LGAVDGVAFRIENTSPITNLTVVLGAADYLVDIPVSELLFWRLFDAFASSSFTPALIDNASGAFTIYNVSPGKYTLGLMGEFCADNTAPEGWQYAWKAAIDSSGQPDLSGLVPAIAFDLENVLIFDVEAGSTAHVDINMPCR
jgi:hypothetical protein